MNKRLFMPHNTYISAYNYTSKGERACHVFWEIKARDHQVLFTQLLW